jgi:hypothetical protein
MPDSSQGSYVTWNGTTIGSVTRWRASSRTSVYVKKTHVGSTVVGTGANSRVVESVDVVSVEPGSVEVGLYGCPLSFANVGQKATVAVVAAAGSVSGEAFLDSFEVTGQVGEFLTGTATFRFSGE